MDLFPAVDHLRERLQVVGDLLALHAGQLVETEQGLEELDGVEVGAVREDTRRLREQREVVVIVVARLDAVGAVCQLVVSLATDTARMLENAATLARLRQVLLVRESLEVIDTP